MKSLSPRVWNRECHQVLAFQYYGEERPGQFRGSMSSSVSSSFRRFLSGAVNPPKRQLNVAVWSPYVTSPSSRAYISRLAFPFVSFGRRNTCFLDFCWVFGGYTRSSHSWIIEFYFFFLSTRLLFFIQCVRLFACFFRLALSRSLFAIPLWRLLNLYIYKMPNIIQVALYSYILTYIHANLHWHNNKHLYLLIIYKQ